MSNLPTPESLRASVPDDADRSYIVADLRSLAVPISSLLPDPRNARKHPEKNLDAVKASLRSFKQRKPVVVNSRTLIVEAGNGTLEAAKALGWQYVAAVFQDDDAVTATGYGLADNRSAELAEWDTDVLTDLIKDLKTDGVDISDLGWSGDDLLAMLPDDGNGGCGDGGDDDPTPIDKAAELQKVWQTARGQAWEIPSKSVPGRCHRVICGDSCDIETVLVALNGSVPDMVFTDPPYNYADVMDVGFYANTNGPAMKALSDTSWDKGFDISKFLAVLSNVRPRNGTVYICTSRMLAPQIWAWSDTEKAKHTSYCVWCKPNPMPSLAKRYWTWATELICFAAFGDHVFNFPKEGHCLNWWEINKNASNSLHTTQKPIDVPTIAIRHSSTAGQIVADFFLGSGTTIMASEQLARVCYGIERDPNYVAVILDRAKSAGLEPRLLE